MKRILAIVLAAMMLLSLIPAASAESDTGVLRDSIVLCESSEWWGADVTQLDGTSFFQRMIGEPVCTLDGDGNLQPNVASEIKVSDDYLTITLTIPEGMYYFSGEQVEPEDVIASIERIQKVCPFASQFATITSMEQDGRDVILHLDHYSADTNAALSSSYMTIMDKDVLDVTTDEELYWDCHPYGMYDLKEYVSGAYVVLERNPGFKCYNPYVENKGASYIQEVTIRFISEEFTTAQEFNAGNLDYIANISADGAAQITREGAVKTLVQTNGQVNYIEMNLTDSIIGDQTIRLAIALAIDREELCEMYNNIIIPDYSFVTSKVRNFNADWEANYKANYCNDPDRARALLDEAGIVDTDGDGIREKDGVPLIIHFVYGQTAYDTVVCQGLQIQLQRELGIYLDLDAQDDNYHYESLGNGDFQMGMSRFGTTDTVQLLQWVLCYFDSFACMPDYISGEDEYMALCDQLAQEPDSAKRTEMVYNMEYIIGDSVLVIPLFTNRAEVVYQEGVTPMVYMGDGQAFVNDMK